MLTAKTVIGFKEERENTVAGRTFGSTQKSFGTTWNRQELIESEPFMTVGRTGRKSTLKERVMALS